MDGKTVVVATPIGGRGDFLISVIFGNKLLYDWNNTCVDRPIDGHHNVTKIHTFGPGIFGHHFNIPPIQPENLKQFFSFRVGLSTPQEFLEVAYFSSIKRPNSLDQDQAFRTAMCLTNLYETEFRKHEFDYVIPFAKLKDIEYLKVLNRIINQQEFTSKELQRINHNIELNQQLLANNPFTTDEVDRALVY